MIYEIIKILPEKKSNNGNTYIRVEFIDENKKFFKMDLCREFRNFPRWQPLLKVGIRVMGVIEKDKMTIDADSRPTLVRDGIENLPDCPACIDRDSQLNHRLGTRQHSGICKTNTNMPGRVCQSNPVEKSQTKLL